MLVSELTESEGLEDSNHSEVCLKILLCYTVYISLLYPGTRNVRENYVHSS